MKSATHTCPLVDIIMSNMFANIFPYIKAYRFSSCPMGGYNHFMEICQACSTNNYLTFKLKEGSGMM